MKKIRQIQYCAAGCLLAAFALWTWAVARIDLQPIGPFESCVGLAGLNGWFHRLTGVHMALYTITDWLSILPAMLAIGFAALGLRQWIQRKNLLKVDASILLLGIFYLAVMGCYLLFETWPINYRPILIAGVLEASYPSSTAMLSLCILPTAILQFRFRIKSPIFRRLVIGFLCLLTAFLVLGRLLSGVHWLSDIIGGALFSAGLVTLYAAVCP